MAKPQKRQQASPAPVPPPEAEEPTMTPSELYGGMVHGERYKEFEKLCKKTDAYLGDDKEGESQYAEAFELPSASWSENFKPSIDVANHIAFLNYYSPWVKDDRSGDEHNAVVLAKDLWLMPTQAYDDLKDAVVGVKDNYPLVDDEIHSEVEMVGQNEAWDSYYRKEFTEFLTEHILDDFEGQVDKEGRPVGERMVELLPTKVDDIFYELLHNGNGGEWDQAQDGDWSLNIERLLTGHYIPGVPTGPQRYQETLQGIYDELYAALYPEDPRQMKLPFPAEEVVETLLEHAVEASNDPAPAAKILVGTLLEGHDYSCVLIHLPEELQDLIVAWGKQQIPKESLFVDKDGDKGREDEIHTTVLYGLFDAMPSPQLLDIFKNTKPFEIALSPVTLFRQDDHDVVKLDVHSAQLHELNREISQACPHHNDFPDYKPHITICYVKKGTCDRLEGASPFDHPVKLGVTSIGTDGKFEAKSVIFSSHANVKKEYSLGPTKLVKEEEEADKPKKTYRLTGSGVDIDGWWKYHLTRSDGKVVKVNKTRYRELRQQGRITEEETVPTMSPGDLATKAGLTPIEDISGGTIRRRVGREIVDSVWIEKVKDESPLGRCGFGTDGVLRIYFRGKRAIKQDWCSYEVLKMSLRQWRNLQGVRLFVNGVESGVVSYKNPALQDKHLQA